MTAAELIEVLSDLDPDMPVLLSVLSRTEDGELATDLYDIGGFLVDDTDVDDGDGEAVGPGVWLVGGDEDDLEEFFTDEEGAEDEE
jgi:hypothetical protein